MKKLLLNRTNTAVVIPAYNEAATIDNVVKTALQQVDHVVVVDDGSTDQTADIVRATNATLIVNQENLGKGASLNRGFTLAASQGMLAVISMDGDGQHLAMDVPLIIAAANHHSNHLVIASRLKNRERAPKARRRANAVADFWISWASGQRVRDSQSGYRLYPIEALKKLKLPIKKTRSFVYESEFLIMSAWNSYPIVSVPVATHYPEQMRASHFRNVPDVTRIIFMVAWKIIKRGLYLNGLWRSLVKPAVIYDEE